MICSLPFTHGHFRSPSLLDYSVLSGTFDIMLAQQENQTLQEFFNSVAAVNRVVTPEHTSHQFLTLNYGIRFLY